MKEDTPNSIHYLIPFLQILRKNETNLWQYKTVQWLPLAGRIFIGKNHEGDF